jgi:hypothetical protein
VYCDVEPSFIERWGDYLTFEYSCCASFAVSFIDQAVRPHRIVDLCLFLNLVLRRSPPLSPTPIHPCVTPSTPSSSEVKLLPYWFPVSSPFIWDTRPSSPWESFLEALEPYIRGPMGRCIKLPPTSNIPLTPVSFWVTLSKALSSKINPCQHLLRLWKEWNHFLFYSKRILTLKRFLPRRELPQDFGKHYEVWALSW